MTEIKLDLADPRVQIRALQLAVERLGSTPLQGASQILTALRDAIEQQVKPAIEEPAEWGSIVRARRVGTGSEDTALLRWQRRYEEVWESEPAGDLGILHESSWEYFTDVEVLRVGVGPQVPSESQRAAQDDAYATGVSDTATKIARWLRQLRAEALTAERQNAYDKAIKLVEELAP